jgi:hypothetical protein
VRVRFDNPTLGQEEHFDIILHPEASVLIERFSVLDREEQFYENPKDPARVGPTATMWVFAYAKSAQIRSGQVTYSLDKDQLPTLAWRSRGGDLAPPPDRTVPPPPSLEPVPLKDKADQQTRDLAIRATLEVVKALDKKDIDVALAEVMASVQKSAERDLVAGKPIAPETFFRWRHAIRCYAAIDDVNFLFGEFSADMTPAQMRWIYMQTLQQWLALSRDNDYVLFEAVRKQYRKTESVNIMRLFHMISSEAAAKPDTYEHLIEGLNNDLMPIRALSHFHLLNLAGQVGQKIAYDPSMPPQLRQKAVAAWLQVIPPGKLPPNAPPKAAPKKDKDKEKK